MEHNILQNGDVLEINLSGRFTFTDNKIFSPIIDGITASQYKRVVVDLGLVDFIDSAALGILLLIRDKCEKASTSLTLVNPRGQVKHMFDVSRFNDLFRIEERE